MKPHQAVIHLSHDAARLIEFDDTSANAVSLAREVHGTHQHHSGVRTEHEFFAQVCDRLGTLTRVLVTGGHTPLQDFQRYVDKHRPQVGVHVLAWQVVDQLTDNQLVALARKRFVDVERLA